MGLTDWFSNKQKFRPKNGFSGLAYAAATPHMESQNLIHSHGKLECYIFYSTYISIISSCLHPQHTDRVDQLLVNGIWDYKNFLNINETNFPSGFPAFVEDRGNLYSKSLKKMFGNKDDNSESTIQKFVLLFETREYKELEELDLDLFRVMSSFDFLIHSLRVINSNGYQYAAAIEHINVNPNIQIQQEVNSKIDDIVVLPFRKPRCMHCGTLTDRTDLKLVPTHTEFGIYNMPTCSICRERYTDDDGYIN